MASFQMKNMSWYPGHMKKALDEIKKSLKIVDLVIEIGDSRAPESSLNSMLDSITQGKKKIILFSKKDLSDQVKVNKWIEIYKGRGIDCFSLDFKDPAQIKNVLKYLTSIKSTKALKYERYNMAVPPLRALVVGIPNVGKSTLINSLVGKKKAQVANKPGLTRTQQLVKLGDKLELFDTPGVLQPNYEDKKAVMHLAWLGSIADQAIPIEQVYSTLAEFMLSDYLDSLYEHYQIDRSVVLSKENIFKTIGQARHFILPQGEVDISRAKIAFLKEFRGGQIVRCVVDDV